MHKTCVAVTGFENGKKGHEVASVKGKGMDSPTEP